MGWRRRALLLLLRLRLWLLFFRLRLRRDRFGLWWRAGADRSAALRIAASCKNAARLAHG